MSVSTECEIHYYTGKRQTVYIAHVQKHGSALHVGMDEFFAHHACKITLSFSVIIPFRHCIK